MSRLHRRLPLVTTVLLLNLIVLIPGIRAVTQEPVTVLSRAQVLDLPLQNRSLETFPVTQHRDRMVRLTLLPDYEQGAVEVIGEMTPGTIPAQAAALTDWGLSDSLEIHPVDAQAWSITGPLSSAHLSAADKNGRYHLTLEPLSLAPGDSLKLYLPFVNIPWQAVDPPPANLAQLTGPVSPPVPSLRYDGGETGQVIQLDIPFTPLRQEIDLALTPLIGEVLLGQTDSFRLSGQVTFYNIEDFGTFERYCQSTPDSPFYRYRVANLLFALDYPPAYHFGFLSQIYDSKPIYTLLRSDLISCQYQTGASQVQAQFTGRVFNVPQKKARFPDFLSRQDVIESHRPYTGFGAVAGEYELKLGEIVLAPGDLLRVSIPLTTIRGVDPPPSRFVYDRLDQTQIEYQGPRRLALSIRYTPEPQLLLRQAPATGRALLAPLETQLGPLFTGGIRPAQRIWAWGLLIVGLGLGVSASRGRDRLQTLGNLGAWLLLSVTLLYGLRGIFGWLLLAVGWYFFGNRPNRPRLLKGGLAMMLVLLAMLADTRAEKFFAVLSTIELELTPVTPLILTLLSLALYRLVTWGEEGLPGSLSQHNLLAATFFLFTLSIYDVLQKSPLALLWTICGATFVMVRLAQRSDEPNQPQESDLLERFQLVRQSWLVPGGVLLFTIFAMQHNLQQTTAIFGPALGLWGPILIPALLFISVLLALSAIAGLFIVLYPVLPFRAGYLKAVGLALFLLVVFVLGIGSDNRLIDALETLLAGRLIYYLSVPLFLGLYFDIDQFRRKENAGRETGEDKQEPLSFEKATGLYLKQLRGLTGTMGGILSLVAPSVYAFLFNQPIVTTYFDLLERLISLSVAGL